MSAKTPLGLGFFDEYFGGVYIGRSTLVSGPGGSGKTTLGMQFLARGLQLQQRGLMLSAQIASDLVIRGDALGWPFTEAVHEGSLTLLEYGTFIPGRDREENISLPPQGFEEFCSLVEEQAIQRLVVDTVLPWMTNASEERLAEHVFSFVRTLERLGVTAMLTIPKPVSLKAIKLFRLIENSVPISISLLLESGDTRSCLINKYLGRDQMGEEVPYEIRAPGGLVGGVHAPEEDRKTPRAADGRANSGASFAPLLDGAPPADKPAEKSKAPASAPQPEPPKRKINFSSIVFGGR